MAYQCKRGFHIRKLLLNTAKTWDFMVYMSEKIRNFVLE